MGEPMLNLDNVLAACERLPDARHHQPAHGDLDGRLDPRIERLAEQPLPLRLALSLHAADEALRSELMPVNDRYPLSDVIDACRALLRAQAPPHLRRVRDAHRRQRPLRAGARAGPRAAPKRSSERSIFKVNLIPYNPTDSPYEGSSRASIAAFRDALAAKASRRLCVSRAAGTSMPLAGSSPSAQPAEVACHLAPDPIDLEARARSGRLDRSGSPELGWWDRRWLRDLRRSCDRHSGAVGCSLIA